MRMHRWIGATCAIAVTGLGLATINAGAATTPEGTSEGTPRTGGALIGMSAPATQFAARLAETGPIQSRRLFGNLDNVGRTVRLAQSEVAAGRYPILSFKVPGNDWAGVGAGRFDTELRALTTQLDAIPGQLFVTLHHEPEKNGTEADFAAMQRHALPILGAPTNVDAGIIGNGFWWSAQGQGLTDAEIAQWIPADVRNRAEIIAADTYHGGTVSNPGENAAVKIRRMGEWADRVGVSKLGIGEYNGLDAAAMTAAGDAILADNKFVFAAVFNSNVNNREGVEHQLTGARLTAFKQTLAKAGAGSRTPVTAPDPDTTDPSSTPAPSGGPAPTTTPTVVRPSGGGNGGNSGGALIGMSAPATQFAARLAETGPIQSRRLFGNLDNVGRTVRLAQSEVAAGRYPILSFKVPGNDWAGVGAGRFDTELRALTTQLDAIPGQLFVTLHHEPEKNGTEADFAAMQRHALPILGAPTNVDAGIIGNGFWWSAQGQGLTDAEIAQWIPADVRNRAEIIAADTYHGGTVSNPGENAAVKIRRMGEWADRVGVSKLGIGEYNGLDAAAMTAAGDAILADNKFVFAAVFNSNVNNREGVEHQLTGARLTAFKQTLAKAGA